MNGGGDPVAVFPHICTNIDNRRSVPRGITVQPSFCISTISHRLLANGIKNIHCPFLFRSGLGSSRKPGSVPRVIALNQIASTEANA
jgi:hypothetical protein